MKKKQNEATKLQTEKINKMFPVKILKQIDYQLNFSTKYII